MTHALVTVVAPLDLTKLGEAEHAIDRLGNPADGPIAAALDRLDGEDGTHFASLHAIKSVDGARAYILFEFSADGTEEAALARIAAAIGDELKSVFVLAADWKDGTDLPGYLDKHRVTIGGGLWDNPGVAFVGTPGMSVGRIRAEDRLGRAVAAILEAEEEAAGFGSEAQARLEAIRATVKADPGLAAMLSAAPTEPPFKEMPLPQLISTLAGSFVTTYLLPALGIAIIAVIAWGIAGAWNAAGFWPTLWGFVSSAVSAAWGAFWILLVLFVVFAATLYLQLRKAEESDYLEQHLPGPLTNTAMFGRENVCAQNHMISVTQRKPGWVRWCTIRLIFWVIGALAPLKWKPGYLSDIGTIHFARWATPPGSPDLVFVSNYGGSWESYLEDFITRAHEGLTGVWSNAIGFPRSENLIGRGATDGDRFKRFARHSMVPTRFWYSAYPHLTTDTIRANARIRAGLSGAMTEDEARRWLALFASAERPANKLVSTDIQSLVFGGLKFMPFASCLIFDLPEGAAARDWLRAIQPHVAFNDGRRLGANAVINLAFGPRGLKRLGLPADGLASFPFAFVSGMTTDHRAKILGDVGVNAPANWRWGREQPDVAMLVYARSAEALATLVAEVDRLAQLHGLAPLYRQTMKPVTRDKTEPFGFVDGVSQPVIRGTYKALRSADSIHVVEPGEFLLGYPDNRGYTPPGPVLSALEDPDHRLPLEAGVDEAFSRTLVESKRDVGFNGSYLVIRELEQDVAGFEAYCEAEAARLRGRLPPPYAIDAEYIGAKLLGRWKDGSSMVRHPYESETARHRKVEELAAQAAERGKLMHGSPALAVESATAMTRTTPHPLDGAPPVEPAPPAIAARKSAPDGEPARPSYADNDFLFGAEDPEALACPFGAHMRRANPRDSLDPGSADQIAISNRHRIMRIGRQYVPTPGQNPGLFFMCLNGDIERQFEFLQQTWLRSPSFHGLSCERDPVLGDAEPDNCGFTIPSRYGPARLSPLPRFVTTKGGGYFFLPGKRLLDYLAALP